MNCLFVACNRGVQERMDAISVIETPYCTQQTGGLTRVITLRAIRARDADPPAKSASATDARATPDIACNTLPCSFTRAGLPPQHGRGRAARPDGDPRGIRHQGSENECPVRCQWRAGVGTTTNFPHFSKLSNVARLGCIVASTTTLAMNGLRPHWAHPSEGLNQKWVGPRSGRGGPSLAPACLTSTWHPELPPESW
jgi:hypothetical protein